MKRIDTNGTFSHVLVVVALLTSMTLVLCGGLLNNMSSQIVEQQQQSDNSFASPPIVTSTLPTTTTTTTKSLKNNNNNNHLLNLDGQGKDVVQTLVLSPHQVGVMVVLGALDIGVCPIPEEYDRHSIVLTLNQQEFDVLSFHRYTGYSGPIVVVHYNVTEPVWRDLLRRPVPLVVRNRIAGTTQSIMPLIDPAMQQRNKKKHTLAATVTVRKTYHYYLGQDKAENQTQPRVWSHEHIQERLNWWIQYHRRLGVQHFYIIDNEHNLLLPTLTIPKRDNDNNNNNSDYTYIRAPYHPYDVKGCPPTQGQQQQHSVSGQSVLENSMIQMANTEWLMVIDFDEFIVPAKPFDNSLVELVQRYQTVPVECHPYDSSIVLDIKCHPVHQWTTQNLAFSSLPNNNDNHNHNDKMVFGVSFSPVLVLPGGEFRSDWVHRRKTIVMPSHTAYLDVHEALPNDPSRQFLSDLPETAAYMAHLQERREQEHCMEKLIPNLPQYFAPSTTTRIATTTTANGLLARRSDTTTRPTITNSNARLALQRYVAKKRKAKLAG